MKTSASALTALFLFALVGCVTTSQEQLKTDGSKLDVSARVKVAPEVVADAVTAENAYQMSDALLRELDRETTETNSPSPAKKN